MQDTVERRHPAAAKVQKTIIVPAEHDETIRRAAVLVGARSTHAFMLASVLDRAQKIVAEAAA